MRMIEARALVALSMRGEQHPADAIAFSAFLAVETYRQASVQGTSLEKKRDIVIILIPKCEPFSVGRLHV